MKTNSHYPSFAFAAFAMVLGLCPMLAAADRNRPSLPSISVDTVKPSAMVMLVGSGDIACPHGGYAFDRVVNSDATLSEFVIPEQKALLLTGIIGPASERHNGTLSIQTATSRANIGIVLSREINQLQDIAIRPGVYLCLQGWEGHVSHNPSVLNQTYLTGHWVKDN